MVACVVISCLQWDRRASPRPCVIIWGTNVVEEFYTIAQIHHLHPNGRKPHHLCQTLSWHHHLNSQCLRYKEWHPKTRRLYITFVCPIIISLCNILHPVQDILWGVKPRVWAFSPPLCHHDQICQKLSPYTHCPRSWRCERHCLNVSNH
jgi:hypothetical protein